MPKFQRREDISSPYHTRGVFEPKKLRYAVRQVKAFLKLHPEITALAGCGNSGVPICAAVSYATGLPYITVRKASEREHEGHGGTTVTGYSGSGKYLIIDDVVDSGSTVRRIITKIREVSTYTLQPYGVLCYNYAWKKEILDDIGNTITIESIPGAF
jgi:adenine/guanine phosphoribosyltransferase-like PRPP-binding protein